MTDGCTIKPSPDLPRLRAEIDRIDAAMHALLIERSAIIDALIAAKRTGETGSAFRPLREAEMMRALAARHDGHLPFSSVEHIWRTLIATFTHLQAPFSVHMAGGADMHDVMRFHFGFDVPALTHETPEAAIAAASATTGALALVPLGEAQTPWWRALDVENGAAIMARLPFCATPGTGSATPAAVIARAVGDGAAREEAIMAGPVDGVPARATVLARAAGEALIAHDTPLDGPWRIVGWCARPQSAITGGDL